MMMMAELNLDEKGRDSQMKVCSSVTVESGDKNYTVNCTGKVEYKESGYLIRRD